MAGFFATFSYAGMPYDLAERNLRTFVKYVMPELSDGKLEWRLEERRGLRTTAGYHPI